MGSNNGLWPFFRDSEHEKQMESLRLLLVLHREQIALRKKSLDRYDLERYNLKEALHRQQSIILS